MSFKVVEQSDQSLVVQINFNQQLNSSYQLQMSKDLNLQLGGLQELKDYTLSAITQSGSQLHFTVKLAKSVSSLKLAVSIPSSSMIQSSNNQILIANGASSLLVIDRNLGAVIVQPQSGSNRDTVTRLSSFVQQMSDSSNGILQLLHQSYLLKALFNSQIIAATLLIDMKVPAPLFYAQEFEASAVFLFQP